MKCKADEWLEEDGLLKIQGWARDGLTLEQIATNMGISRSTLREWTNKFPAISSTLKKGKEVVDREVENSLYMRALGFKTEVQKPIKVKETEYDKFGRKIAEKEVIKYVTEEVYVAPDTTAMIFWLKNRKPSVWRDKVETYNETTVEAAGVIEIPAVLENE